MPVHLKLVAQLQRELELLCHHEARKDRFVLEQHAVQATLKRVEENSTQVAVVELGLAVLSIERVIDVRCLESQPLAVPENNHCLGELDLLRPRGRKPVRGRLDLRGLERHFIAVHQLETQRGVEEGSGQNLPVNESQQHVRVVGAGHTQADDPLGRQLQFSVKRLDDELFVEDFAEELVAVAQDDLVVLVVARKFKVAQSHGAAAHIDDDAPQG